MSKKKKMSGEVMQSLCRLQAAQVLRLLSLSSAGGKPRH